MPDYWFTITVSNFPGEDLEEARGRILEAVANAYLGDSLTAVNLDDEGTEYEP